MIRSDGGTFGWVISASAFLGGELRTKPRAQVPLVSLFKHIVLPVCAPSEGIACYGQGMGPTRERALLAEDEYRRDYDIIRNDVSAAMVCCYTQRAINDIAVADPAVLQRLNRSATFWRINSFSLQGMLFIVLARILDTDPGVHSIHQLLRASTAHPEFFSKDGAETERLLQQFA